MQKERIMANAINLIPGMDAVKLNLLLKQFGSFARIWEQKRSALGIMCEKKMDKGQILKAFDNIDPEKSFQKLADLGIETTIIAEATYPQQLKEIPNPPPAIYTRGSIKALSGPGLAVVGTRKMSLYGKQAVLEIVPGLSATGLSIISGMAFGVDSEALNSALAAGIVPIAVLASPLDDDSLSPKSNFNLAKKIIENGCVVSEYALGRPVYKQNFLDRNRIISGLSLGVLVIEAPLVSGALSTATFALEQNRLVLAVPGSIFSEVSAGCLKLIKAGAATITGLSDIFKELNLDLMPAKDTAKFNGSDIERSVLGSLGRTPKEMDQIVRDTKLKPELVMQTLTMLEIKGMVSRIGNNHYVKGI
ncbi:MAG: DNA-processing protein DprA [Acidobacteriaceae bacterium]